MHAVHALSKRHEADGEWNRFPGLTSLVNDFERPFEPDCFHAWTLLKNPKGESAIKGRRLCKKNGLNFFGVKARQSVIWYYFFDKKVSK
jgi:hypothetical protein